MQGRRSEELGRFAKGDLPRRIIGTIGRFCQKEICPELSVGLPKEICPKEHTEQSLSEMFSARGASRRTTEQSLSEMFSAKGDLP